MIESKIDKKNFFKTINEYLSRLYLFWLILPILLLYIWCAFFFYQSQEVFSLSSIKIWILFSIIFILLFFILSMVIFFASLRIKKTVANLFDNHSYATFSLSRNDAIFTIEGKKRIEFLTKDIETLFVGKNGVFLYVLLPNKTKMMFVLENTSSVLSLFYDVKKKRNPFFLFFKIFLLIITISLVPFFIGFVIWVGEYNVFSNLGLINYSWVCLLALIPLMLVFIFSLIKKDKKNVVSSIICSSILLTIGLLVSLKPLVKESTTFTENLYEQYSIYLPKKSKTLSINRYGGVVSYSKFLDKAERHDFAMYRINADEWAFQMCDVAKKTIPSQVRINHSFGCLYVVELNEYNPKTIEPGTYSLIYMTTDSVSLFTFETTATIE